MKYLRTNTYLGYIEGYYGNLLNWRERNSIVLSLKQNNMNADAKWVQNRRELLQLCGNSF